MALLDEGITCGNQPTDSSVPTVARIWAPALRALGEKTAFGVRLDKNVHSNEPLAPYSGDFHPPSNLMNLRHLIVGNMRDLDDTMVK